MIVETAVLVVRDDEERARPQRIVRAQRVVHARDQLVAAAHIVRWMLVGRIAAEIVGLDPRERREIFLGAGGEREEIAFEIVAPTRMQPHAAQDRRHRQALAEDACLDALVGEAVEDRRLTVRPRGDGRMARIRHVPRAGRRAGQREQAIRPGRSRQRGKPAIADDELARETVQRGQGVTRGRVADREVRHDLCRERIVRAGIGPAEVVDEAGHRCRAGRDLAIDVFGLVADVDAARQRVLRVRSLRDIALRGRIEVLARTGAIDAVDIRIDAAQIAEHLIERAVLQHQHDDVPDRILRACHEASSRVECGCYRCTRDATPGYRAGL